MIDHIIVLIIKRWSKSLPFFPMLVVYYSSINFRMVNNKVNDGL